MVYLRPDGETGKEEPGTVRIANYHNKDPPETRVRRQNGIIRTEEGISVCTDRVGPTPNPGEGVRTSLGDGRTHVRLWSPQGGEE